MKGLVIITVLLASFYMTSMHLVMGQLKYLEEFYSNMDYYTAQSLGSNQKTALKPEPLKSAAQPVLFGN